jgi:serine/threonine-protein kinase
VYAARNQNDLAQLSLRRALQLDANAGDAHVALGRVYERLGRPQEAEAAYERGVALQPDSWQNLFMAGSFYYRQGKYARAIDAWQRVVELTPDNALAHTNLGAALLDTGHLSEARAAYQRVIELGPTYTAFMNLGKIYFLQGRFADAAGAFEKAAGMNREDYVPVGNLAAAYAWVPGMQSEAGPTFTRAAALAEAAAKASPTDPTIFADLSVYYANLGQSDLSRRRLQTAMALDQSNPGVYAAAAEAEEILRNRDAALIHARRAIALGYRREEFQRNPALRGLLADPRLAASSPRKTPSK